MGQLDLSTPYAVQRGPDQSSAFGEHDVSVTVRRALAALIDASVLGVVMLFFVRNFGLIARKISVTVPIPAGLPSVPHKLVLSGLLLRPVPLVLFTVIYILYFTASEASFGWSPGKLICGIRVVDFYGGRPDLLQAFVRNLFRLLDGFPFFIPNLTGGVILLSNRRHQRGGDKAAGTLVVDRRSYSAQRTVRRIREAAA